MLSHLSRVRLGDPMRSWAPLSIEFPRKDYWSGLPFSSPGDLPNPGIEPVSLTSPSLAGWFFTTGATYHISGVWNWKFG